MALDTETLVQMIAGLGGVITAIGGLQIARDTRVRKERDQLRVQLDERDVELAATNDLLSSALRFIRRAINVFAGNDLSGPPLPPDLQELMRGAPSNEPEPRPGRPARPRRRAAPGSRAGT